MRTIAIINLKGGVAKTTSSINIAYILTQRGYKVLLVDNDKQGDCSRGLNRRTQDGDGIDRIMVDRHPDMDNLIHHTDYANLDIITANLGLLTANTEVIKDPIRPQQDRKAGNPVHAANIRSEDRNSRPSSQIPANTFDGRREQGDTAPGNSDVRRTSET